MITKEARQRPVNYYDNGIVKLPFDPDPSGRKFLTGAMAAWLIDHDFGSLDIAIINAALLDYASLGAEEFPVRTLDLVDATGATPNEIWLSVESLVERGLLKRRTSQFCPGTSLEFAAPDDALLNINNALAPPRHKRPLSRDSTNCFIYVADNGNHRKIGISKNPKSRLAAFRSATPVQIEFAAQIPSPRWLCREVEAQALSNFKTDIIDGEWLTTSAESLVRFINDALDRRAGVS